jgi:hypothetical protein
VAIRTAVQGIVFFLLVIPSTTWGYTSFCALYAQALQHAARTYDSARSQFERQKTTYDSACNERFGNACNDDACGPAGSVTSSYNSAGSDLEAASLELIKAIGDAGSFCGISQDDTVFPAVTQLIEENKRLKQRVEQAEQQLKQKTGDDAPLVTSEP